MPLIKHGEQATTRTSDVTMNWFSSKKEDPPVDAAAIAKAAVTAVLVQQQEAAKKREDTKAAAEKAKQDEKGLKTLPRGVSCPRRGRWRLLMNGRCTGMGADCGSCAWKGR